MEATSSSYEVTSSSCEVPGSSYEVTSSSYEVPAETGYNYDGGSSDASAARAKHGNNKVGEGLARTKAVASTGVKKVKEGTSTAIHWIKDKCHHKSTSTTTTPAPIFSSS